MTRYFANLFHFCRIIYLRTYTARSLRNRMIHFLFCFSFYFLLFFISILDFFQSSVIVPPPRNFIYY